MKVYKKLLKLYGNKSAIARQFGVERQTVAFWEKTGVPIKWARDISRLTNGAVTADDVIKG